MKKSPPNGPSIIFGALLLLGIIFLPKVGFPAILTTALRFVFASMIFMIAWIDQGSRKELK